MTSYETRSRLADLLLAISDGDRQIEILRQILCEQSLFEPYASFKRIDRLKKGAIGAYDLMSFLADNGIFYTEKQCKAVVRRYDLDEDGGISYNEYLNLVLPQDNPKLRSIASQRPNYPVGAKEMLPYDVEHALAKVIDREIAFYINIDGLKLGLSKRFDFSALAAFGAIDRFSTGKIDFDNLKSFFRGQAIYPNDDEIVAILRRLDKDGDGILKFVEFSEGLDVIDALALIKEAPVKIRESSPKKNADLLASELRYSSPSKRSPNKIATSSHSHNKQTPSKRGTPLKTSEFISKSPYRSPSKTALSPRRTLTATSPLKKSNVYSSYTDQVSPHSPGKRYATPKRSKLEDDYYNNLLISMEKNSAKKLTPNKTFTSKFELSASKNNIKEKKNYNPDQIDAFIHTIKQFVVLDKELEAAKQDLSLRPDFNLFDFFRTLDIPGTGYVSAFELENGFRKYGIYPNKEELNLFIKRFDHDRDGRLKFSDFADAFAPKQTEYNSLLLNREPVNGDMFFEISQLFKLETRSLIGKVIRLALENEGSSEGLRQKLLNKHLFDSYEIFNYFDMGCDGMVDKNEFRNRLEKHNTFLTERELSLVMDRLDANKDGVIAYAEWINELNPRSEKVF